MRNGIIVTTVALAAALVLPSAAGAQARGGGNQNAAAGAQQAQGRGGANQNIPAQPSIAPPEGWKRCPRCQNNEDRRLANIEYKTDSQINNPKDLTGVWGWNGFGGTGGPVFRTPPPMTPLGKQLLEASVGEKTASGEILRSTDTTGLGIGAKVNCDPYGTTRLYVYNYGFEFIMLPDRVLQFFEITHTWRTIWTDGRKLPENPPEHRWMGWNVGRWEGDTFVVESNGYVPQSWIDQADPDGGWPHSDEMRIVERYRRPNFTTIEAQMTIYDPKIYTEPWVTPKMTNTLSTGAELWEDFCVASDYYDFNEETGGVAVPASAPR